MVHANILMKNHNSKLKNFNSKVKNYNSEVENYSPNRFDFRKWKKIELHRHLDCSMRLSTMMAIAQEQGLVKIQNESDKEKFKNEFLVRSKSKNLAEVLRKFSNAQKLLQGETSLELLAYECVEDMWLEGIVKAELRYSPHYIKEVNEDLSFKQIHEALFRGVEKARVKFPVEVHFIVIMLRTKGPETAKSVADFVFSRPPGVVGIDLAEDETYSALPFLEIFQEAKNKGMGRTLHAGEVRTQSAVANVEQAIKLFEVSRIGHGLQAIHDKNICGLLRERQVTLEICPSSNVITSAIGHIRSHPLKKLFKMGIRTTINTDDPGMFDITLSGEFALVARQLHLHPKDLMIMNRFAEDALFFNKGI